jgi:hypothetical protein
MDEILADGKGAFARRLLNVIRRQTVEKSPHCEQKETGDFEFEFP